VTNPTPHLSTGSPRGMWTAIGVVLAGPALGLYLGLAASCGFAWWPSSEALARWLRHPANPAAAAPASVSIRPGVALFTAAAVTTAVWMLGAVALGARIRHHSVGQRGLATRRDARSMSTSAVRARATTLRPVRGAGSIHDVGVFVGYREGHEPVWATIEDTFSVIGPARSGKTSRLIAPTVTRWPGAAVVTGLRPDVLEWTVARAQRGRRWVFDPGRRLVLSTSERGIHHVHCLRDCADR
jgi:type IV secretory pathway TraG/TraD family ATPase VirD4